MVEISQELYDQLMDESHMLDCLLDAGVDNWSGYEYAMREYYKDRDD